MANQGSKKAVLDVISKIWPGVTVPDNIVRKFLVIQRNAATCTAASMDEYKCCVLECNEKILHVPEGKCYYCTHCGELFCDDCLLASFNYEENTQLLFFNCPSPSALCATLPKKRKGSPAHQLFLDATNAPCTNAPLCIFLTTLLNPVKRNPVT
jgi:hypothetical protein